jgi:hypothetical protein
MLAARNKWRGGAAAVARHSIDVELPSSSDAPSFITWLAAVQAAMHFLVFNRGLCSQPIETLRQVCVCNTCCSLSCDAHHARSLTAWRALSTVQELARLEQQPAEGTSLRRHMPPLRVRRLRALISSLDAAIDALHHQLLCWGGMCAGPLVLGFALGSSPARPRELYLLPVPPLSGETGPPVPAAKDGAVSGGSRQSSSSSALVRALVRRLLQAHAEIPAWQRGLLPGEPHL